MPGTRRQMPQLVAVAAWGRPSFLLMQPLWAGAVPVPLLSPARPAETHSLFHPAPFGFISSICEVRQGQRVGSFGACARPARGLAPCGEPRSLLPQLKHTPNQLKHTD